MEATAARAFTAYAEGDHPDVQWADVVTYTIGGHEVARFDSAFADRRDTWDGCPRVAPEDTRRNCPISPLDTIAAFIQDGGEVAYETVTPATVGCHRYPVGNPETGTTIWIRPSEASRKCASDFAVAILTDEWGTVAWVDFAPPQTSHPRPLGQPSRSAAHGS